MSAKVVLSFCEFVVFLIQLACLNNVHFHFAQTPVSVVTMSMSVMLGSKQSLLGVVPAHVCKDAVFDVASQKTLL